MKTVEPRNLNYASAPDKTDWDYVMANSGSADILQSWEFGEALEKSGPKILRILLFNNGVPVSAMQGALFEEWGISSHTPV